MNTSVELTELAAAAVGGPMGALSVSELHGAVVGVAAGNPEVFSVQSLVDLLGVDALSDEETVEAFVNESLSQLFSEDLTFEALLPDDEATLAERLAALSEWTSGFLAGLVAGVDLAGGAVATLPEEVQEIVRDFSAIAEVETDSDEPDAEMHFVQLTEFVKVGALLVVSAMSDADNDSGE